MYSIGVLIMATAFVLINAEVGAEREILKSLKNIKEVKESHPGGCLGHNYKSRD